MKKILITLITLLITSMTWINGYSIEVTMPCAQKADIIEIIELLNKVSNTLQTISTMDNIPCISAENIITLHNKLAQINNDVEEKLPQLGLPIIAHKVIPTYHIDNDDPHIPGITYQPLLNPEIESQKDPLSDPLANTPEIQPVFEIIEDKLPEVTPDIILEPSLQQ